MLRNAICGGFIAALVVAAAKCCFAEGAYVEKVVPESYVSKAWTVRTTADVETRVTFWRAGVFRIETGLKVADTNAEASVQTEISATGQYITTTNAAYTVAYADELNDPSKTQILLPDATEDSSRVRFSDSPSEYVWSTTALTLVLNKEKGVFRCLLSSGEEVFAQPTPVEFVAATSNTAAQSVLRLSCAPGANYFGGGQQNGDFIHTGKKIQILADCKWDEGGHPNPAPWMISRAAPGVYFGILRHTFAPGEYDFTDPQQIAMAHSEARFDAFFFVGRSFDEILDGYTQLTGRPNFIPVWGLELGDADAWMTRDKETREPKQNDDLSYTETTLDVIERNAERYRADDMPCGWLLVNDGYGCKYMQLAWVVEALKGLGFHTGLWTEGALDRMAWEVGTAGTRVQKIDVAWSGPAYQHGLECNNSAYRGFMDNSDARAFIWTCQGWAGTQRYAVCWTGDQYGNWDLIRYHIPTVTGSGMSAQAYATTDIDGIFGGSNETFLRDLQWKCFTPALYVMNGWSDVNKAPWSYPEPYKSIIRAWLKWKLRLTPYMYALCREAWERGTPIVRPLAWNYPDDETALGDSVKYLMMLGRDFLVAPVYEPMETTDGWYLRGIYLPEGTWYDYNDGRRVLGGKWLTAYPVTLETLPVFVRGGAIVPMYPETLYSTQVPKDTITFDIWPDGASGFDLYEDDGETRAYERGEWTRQRIRVSAPPAAIAGDIRIEIDGVTGAGYTGAPEERAYELWLHTAAKPASVIADGMEVLALSATNSAAAAAIYKASPQCWYYDAAEKGGTVKIRLSKRPVKDAVRLAVAIPAAPKAPSAEYPVPPPEVVERAAKAAKAVTRAVAPNNAPHLYQQPGGSFTLELAEDEEWERVEGSVVCSKDTSPDARVTFRLVTDKGEMLFERLGQKGADAPQLVAVNIPKGVKSLTFTFTRDASSPAVPALGVWKDIRLVK